jgi:cytochrome c biogenesis protein CcmG/thiol:disulfide interchange protein DsbE
MTADADIQATTVEEKKRGFGKYLVLIAALAFVALLAYGLMTAGDDRVEAGKAPDFSLTSFDGETYRLSEMEGQVVVVNFWATWCVSCKDEAVDLEAAWREFKDDGVMFIGVDYLDQKPGNLEWIENYDITYPNGDDIQGRIYNAYGVQGLPETFVINRNGEVTKAFIGAVTREQLTTEIAKALGQDAG